MVAKELRDKKITEINKILNDQVKELEKTANDVYKGKEKNLEKLRTMRRNIAKIRTVIREKEILEEVKNG